MNSQSRLIGFMFSRLNRKPRSAKDLSGNAWLMNQRRQIVGWLLATGGDVVETIVGTTTSTKPAFAKSPEFRRAIQRAIDTGADIVLADIQEMLGRSDAKQILDSVHILDAAPVNIWDASRNTVWASLSSEMRSAVMIKAIAVRASRSKTIKAGVRRRAMPPKAPADNDRQRGASANRKKADMKARRLADFVNAERKKLTLGEELSPSRLAKALNDAGIQPDRAAAWGHNSAKNLVRRLASLGLIAPAN